MKTNEAAMRDALAADIEKLIVELRSASAWAKAPYAPLPEHCERSTAPFEAAYALRMLLAARATQPAQAAPGGARDQLYEAIEKVLLHHRISTWRDGYGGALPLVDRLCDENSHTIESGRHELRLICDAIYNDDAVNAALAAAPAQAQLDL